MKSASEWVLSSSLARTVTGIVTGALLGVSPASAAVYASQREALEAAFPDASKIERRSFVLSEAQAEKVRSLARAPLASKLVSFHIASKGETILGYARIDVHTVRTLPEALMVVLTPDGTVRSVRMLAFHEPEDYRPTSGWLAQFEGRTLGPDLQLRRGIQAMAGSTLSARAATRSIRTSLALYQILFTEPEE